ncbi:MAG: radical SAM protein, partial [Spirochaetes bacterium]|nr:radical SAM protein [Spirochaetota bacterium]
MKLLLAQLPLIDHARGYLYGNVEYGPAAIAAYLRRDPGATEVVLLPQAVSCFGSDSLIARYIAAERPEAVGFTCFLWNVERTLSIARKVRDAGVTTVILGGPEIEEGSVALGDHGTADYLVSGEGEWFFTGLLSGRDMSPYAGDAGGARLVRQPADRLIPAGSIAEPFSRRMLDTGLDGTAYLELVRGCPHRCSYCFYSKRARTVRELPFEVLLCALETRRDMRELYVMAPAFERSRAFREGLSTLARRNPGVALHTEMRAGGIDAATAAMLHRAGFRSLEVGLQTLNRRALEIAGRRGDPEDELAGMLRLR